MILAFEKPRIFNNAKSRADTCSMPGEFRAVKRPQVKAHVEGAFAGCMLCVPQGAGHPGLGTPAFLEKKGVK